MPGRHLSRQRLIALLSASCLLVVACGDDSDDSSSSAGEPPAGLSLAVEPATATPGSTVRAYVVNDTTMRFTYGAAYALEHEIDGSFERVEIPKMPVPEIGYVAPVGERGPAVEVELPDDLDPGTYRVVLLEVSFGELGGEFEVTGG